MLSVCWVRRWSELSSLSQIRPDVPPGSPQSKGMTEYRTFCTLQSERGHKAKQRVAFQSQASVQPYDPTTYFFHKFGSSFNQLQVFSFLAVCVGYGWWQLLFRLHSRKQTSRHKMVVCPSRRLPSETSSRWSSSSWTRPCWITWTTLLMTSMSLKLFAYFHTSHSARPWAWSWYLCWESCFTSRRSWLPASSETSKTTSSRSSPLVAWSWAPGTTIQVKEKWVGRGKKLRRS